MNRAFIFHQSLRQPRHFCVVLLLFTAINFIVDNVVGNVAAAQNHSVQASSLADHSLPDHSLHNIDEGPRGSQRPSLHKVSIDQHEFALWHRPVSSAKATILLLHGRTYSALPDFDLQLAGESLSFMRSLNQLGYDVYALDSRGYGHTARDSSGWLTPDRAAQDVIGIIQWIQQQTQRKLHIYGWSYGAMVSQLVAQRKPDLIASMLLFGYPFDPARHIHKLDKTYPSQPPAIKNTSAHAASDFITAGTISPQAIQAYTAAALRADPIRVDFKNLHEWSELDASRIIIPTLLIQAPHDPLARTDLQQAFFTQIKTPEKWWVVLKDGDHAALLETPRDEMLAVMDFFIRLHQDRP
ncbi:MAG: alpha/beta fold hydrolase [Pseudomonadales bacterium]|nr:alpha/beta fold hydrolase [Pseudomonadales bacterium]